MRPRIGQTQALQRQRAVCGGFRTFYAEIGRRYENKQEKAEGLHSFPSAAHSGRQRRPHKALRGFLEQNRKPPVRGCCLKKLACLGVADFKQKIQQKGGILNAHTEG